MSMAMAGRGPGMGALLLTQRGARVLDRARDRSPARINPFWAAVTAVAAFLLIFGVLLALRLV